MSDSLAGRRVILGDLRRTACPNCGHLRSEQDAIVLDDDGVQGIATLLGALGSCPCGAWWVCGLCPARLPLDGASAWAHVKAEHDG